MSKRFSQRALIDSMRPMSLRRSYEGRGLESFDVFEDGEDDTLILTLTVEHGTFTIRLDTDAARILSDHLATAARR